MRGNKSNYPARFSHLKWHNKAFQHHRNLLSKDQSMHYLGFAQCRSHFFFLTINAKLQSPWKQCSFGCKLTQKSNYCEYFLTNCGFDYSLINTLKLSKGTLSESLHISSKNLKNEEQTVKVRLLELSSMQSEYSIKVLAR